MEWILGGPAPHENSGPALNEANGEESGARGQRDGERWVGKKLLITWPGHLDPAIPEANYLTAAVPRFHEPINVLPFPKPFKMNSAPCNPKNLAHTKLGH